MNRTFVLLALLGQTLLCAAPADLRAGDRTYTTLRKARADRYDLTFTLSPQKDADGFTAIDLVFSYKDETHFARFRWDANGYRVERVTEGAPELLTEGVVPIFPALRKGGTVVIKRRARWLEVVVENHRLLRILATGIGRGQIACAQGTGYANAKVRYQKVGDVVFGDDFMRTEEEAKDLGLWEKIGGRWEIHSVMERIQANPAARIREGREPVPDRSPNPFSLSGASAKGTSDEALMLVGHTFWDDYDAEVSVKSMRSEFGLVFAARDADNFWLARWSLRSLGIRKRTVELVHRVRGTDTVVETASFPGRAENWYRLGARILGGRIDVLIDGTPVIRTESDDCVGGRIGLYSRGENETFFDDVSARPIPSVPFDTKTMLRGHAEAVAGGWELIGAPGDLHFEGYTKGRLLTSGESLYALGAKDWPPHCFRAQITPVGSVKAFGLFFAMTAPDTYRAAIWRSRGGGTLELISVNQGQTAVHAVSACPIELERPVDFVVDLRQKGLVLVRVDDDLQIRHPCSENLTGRLGLYALARSKIVFSKVEAFAEPSHSWETPVNIERFADDPFMQGWASPRYAWVRPDKESAPDVFPQRYVHKGDFYGAFKLDLPLNNGLKVFWGRDTLDLDGGYRLEAKVDENGKSGQIVVYRQGELLHTATITPGKRKVIAGKQVVDEKIGAQPRTPDTVTYGVLQLARDGKAIWCSLDGSEVFNLHDDDPLAGRTVALELPEQIDFLHIAVVRERVKDYLFEQAAVDWTKIGQWEVTNRFACDPRWSTLNGRSKGLAALWNKFEFEGDFTVEYYAGMRMRQGDMHEGAARMYYPRVGDINVALNADGRDFFSGYNFMLAAWDPMWSETWTQFWQKGKVVRKTDREFIPRNRHRKPSARVIKVDWDPGGRPIHGAWYFIKIRKTGKRYDVFFDNVPVFSHTDRNPLDGRRIALWTQHNSIVIARAKIGYTRCSRPALLEDDKSTAVNDDATDSELPALRSYTHPGLLCGFEGHYGGFMPMAGDQSAELTLAPTEDGGQALRLENLHPGGDFGAVLPLRDMDLGSVDTIEFDCAIPKDVKVNLYFSFKDNPRQRHFVRLTGPAEDAPNLTSIGEFEKVSHKGKWRRMSFPMGKAIRAALPWRKSLVANELVIGMLHEGYLNVGLGGNPAGAAYLLDNVRIVSHGGAEVGFLWDATKDNAPKSRIWFTRPGEKAEEAQGLVETTAIVTRALPEPGLWQANASVNTNGAWQPVRPWLLRIAEPLKIAEVVPASGENWDGGDIRVQFDAKSDTLLDLAHTSFFVNGSALALSEANTTYDCDERLLTIAPAGVAAIADGGEVRFSLHHVDSVPRAPIPTPPPPIVPPAVRKTKDGDTQKKNAAPPLPKPVPPPPAEKLGTKVVPYKWQAKMDYASDRVPPGRVRLLGGQCPRYDFEGALAQSVEPASEGSHVQLSRVTGPDGGDDHALRVQNILCGGQFSVKLALEEYPVGRYPIISFDYRVDEHAKIDFGMKTSRKARKVNTIGFTDCEETPTFFGAIPGIVADGTWRHAEANIMEIIMRSPAGAKTSMAARKVVEFCIGDFGYAGNAPGASFEIDNLHLIPIVSVNGGGTFSWTCTDPSGIAGYSYLWNHDSDTDAPETIMTKEDSASFDELPEKDAFLHIRACDGAGNWGKTAHYRFLVDNTPPKILATIPADGANAAESKVQVTFAEDTAGVNPAKLILTFNGKRLRAQPTASVWNADTRTFTADITTDWRFLRGQVADGSTMEVTLSGITDYAGNQAEPATWAWTVDYTTDKTPPDPPTMYSYSANLRAYDHFTGKASAYWRVYTPAEATDMKVVRDEQTGSDCLEIRRSSRATTRFSAYRSRSQMTLADYPGIQFDYRIKPGSRINMMLWINKKWYTLRMTGKKNRTFDGEILGVVDDGAWHQASLDMPPIIAKALPDLKGEPDFRLICFGGWNEVNPDGAYIRIDNFSFIGAQPPIPLASLSAADATGISGFEAAFTNDPEALPNVPIDTGTKVMKKRIVADKKGMWWLLARAQDGAGNWSETVRLPYLVEAPAANHPKDGLEAAKTWSALDAKRKRTAAYTYVAKTPGGNTMVAVQMMTTRSKNAQLTYRLKKDLPKAVKITADLYVSGEKPLELKLLVRTSAGKRLLGKPFTLKPGTWLRDHVFTIAPEQVAQLKGDTIACWDIGFELKPHKRSRDVLLVDQIRIDGKLALE
ncbi:MAG: Ig-like domain-containing protein [Lentisphaeria bacterium]|nr:Ig-like domain-containing protein [Lentisphaeria bacterium]